MNLQRLAQPLSPDRIKSRTDGRGGSLSYLETHDVIRAANDIFGYGGWGHEVIELRNIGQVTVHSNATPPKAGIAVGYVCVVKVHVEGHQSASGVGFGDATEYRESASVTAHELAAKEAESDALKRALKNWGDQFGLALYDKASATAGRIGNVLPLEETLYAKCRELNADVDLAPVRAKVDEKRGTASFVTWLEQQVVKVETSIAAKKADEAAASEPSAFQAPGGVAA